MRFLHLAGLVLTTLLLALSPASPAQAVGTAVRAAPTFNGTVYAIAYRGSTVYVGGSFTRATWAGRTFERQRLAAFDARTGTLLSWAPAADSTVRALIAAGDSVYAAGNFHAVDGQKRDSIARLHPETGVVRSFTHAIDGTPYALAAGNGRLYLGGSFTAVDGVKRRNLAAFTLTTGRLDKAWKADADDRVHTLATAGARLFLGGAFHKVNGVSSTLRLAAVSGRSGALDQRFRPKVTAEVNSVAVDASGVYVATGGQGGRAVAYALDGSMRWQRVFDGDAVAITNLDGITYVGGHFDRACLTPRNGPQGACMDGAVPRVKLAAMTGTGLLTPWAPQANGVIGVRVLTANRTAGTLDAGGDFTVIAGQPRPRFASF